MIELCGRMAVAAALAGLLALSAWVPWIGTLVVYGVLAGGLALIWQAMGRGERRRGANRGN